MFTAPIASTNSTPPHEQEQRRRISRTRSSCKRADDGVEAGVDQDLFQRREAIQVARVERIELLLRLLDRGAGLQPPDHRPVVAVARVV